MGSREVAAECGGAGSGSPSLPDMGDNENICKDRDDVSDVPTFRKEGPLLTKRKKKAGGFNLRKSLAWNPAFFSEEGVLDNMELSMLSGSKRKVNGSPSSRTGSKMSPLLMFGKSGNRSVLHEVENSRGKVLAKFRSTHNNGRKLFSTGATSVRDEQKEHAATENTKSARSIKKSIPRSPATYPQKKAANSSATTPMSKIPKFTPKNSQPSIPLIPRNTTSTTKISKPNKNIVPAKGDQTPGVAGLPPKLKMAPLMSTKSSAHDIQKDLEPPITCRRISESSAPAKLPEEANSSGYGKLVSSHSQSSPSISIAAPAPAFAKPSALRMPSPSVGFFAQAKAPVSHGNNTQRNVEKCFTGNPPSIIKPPRQKRPEDLKSRLCLPKQQPANGFAISKSRVQNVPAGSPVASLATSFPCIKSVDPSSSMKESSSMEIIRDSGRTGNRNTQELSKVDCLSIGNNTNKQSPSSEKIDNGGKTPNEHDDASQGERSRTAKEKELTEDSRSLKALCSPTKACVGSEFSSPSISPEVCYMNDLHDSKSDKCAAAGINLKNSPVGETRGVTCVASLKSEDCAPSSDSMLDLGSICDHKNTECSTSMEATPSITVCAEQEALDAVLSDLKPDVAESKAELHDSLAEEVQPILSEEPNTEGRMELDTNNLSDVEGALIIEKDKPMDESRTNSVKNHQKHLVPFSEEWLAAMEAYGEEFLELKSGAVQNSPTDKTVPEPSPWSPVKRKAQDVGPFDCTKYSKSVRTSDTP